jgi:hypothetical protein
LMVGGLIVSKVDRIIHFKFIRKDVVPLLIG